MTYHVSVILSPFSTYWAVHLWFNNNKNVFVQNAQPLFIHDDIKGNSNIKFKPSINILAENTKLKIKNRRSIYEISKFIHQVTKNWVSIGHLCENFK